jgi:hypothetical protein
MTVVKKRTFLRGQPVSAKLREKLLWLAVERVLALAHAHERAVSTSRYGRLICGARFETRRALPRASTSLKTAGDDRSVDARHGGVPISLETVRLVRGPRSPHDTLG